MCKYATEVFQISDLKLKMCVSAQTHMHILTFIPQTYVFHMCLSGKTCNLYEIGHVCCVFKSIIYVSHTESSTVTP